MVLHHRSLWLRALQTETGRFSHCHPTNYMLLILINQDLYRYMFCPTIVVVGLVLIFWEVHLKLVQFLPYTYTGIFFLRQKHLTNKADLWTSYAMPSVEAWMKSTAHWILAGVLPAPPNRPGSRQQMETTQVRIQINWIHSLHFQCTYALISIFLIFGLLWSRFWNVLHPHSQRSRPPTRWSASVSCVVARNPEWKCNLYCRRRFKLLVLYGV